MKKTVYTFMMVMISYLAIGQNHYTSTDNNDPKATKILNALKQDYKSLESVKMDFQLEISSPQGQDIQTGTIYQKGSRFAVETGMQNVYNNGESVWIYSVDNNEVQILDAEEDESGLITPETIMNMYEDEGMIYAITDYPVIKGTTYTKIDFKPESKSSEYLMMSIVVDAKKNVLDKITVVTRDGGRFVMSINNTSKNITISDSKFTFDESSHPNVFIEDLRLD